MIRRARLEAALVELGAELSTVRADNQRMAVLLKDRRDRVAEQHVRLLETQAENESLLRALTALTRERVPS